MKNEYVNRRLAPLLVAFAALSLMVGPIADASTVINGNAAGAFTSATFGATPATAGAIRLSNNTGTF